MSVLSHDPTPQASRRRSALGLVFALLLFTFLLCLCAFLLAGRYSTEGYRLFSDHTTASLRISCREVLPSAGDTELPTHIRRVVIDAGHGGEDSGAQSQAGLYEKDINLAVALDLRDLFEAAGIPVVMTRTEDILLYDRHVDFKGRKKMLDLTTRLNIAQAVPDSLLISVHMNAFPLSQYSGTQVWYAPAHADSQRISEAVQARAQWLNEKNNRRVKAAGSNIYILHHLDTPAILVEGGFLSNPEEAAKLGDEAYQKALAFVIFTAVMEQLHLQENNPM